MAGVVCRDGRHDEAVAMYHEALAVYEKAYGPAHLLVAVTKSNIAIELGTQGRYEEAIAMYREALPVQERWHGPEHPLTADAYSNIGSFYVHGGRLAEASTMYERSFEIKRKALGESHPNTVRTQASLLDVQLKLMQSDSELLVAKGRLPEAREMYRQALSVRWKVFGGGHPETVKTEASLAAVELKLTQS